LHPPLGFPNVEINVPDLTETPRVGGDGVDLRPPVYVTSRSEDQFILDFNLALHAGSGPPVRRA
jgi:hypothetical protein